MQKNKSSIIALIMILSCHSLSAHFFSKQKIWKCLAGGLTITVGFLLHKIYTLQKDITSLKNDFNDTKKNYVSLDQLREHTAQFAQSASIPSSIALHTTPILEAHTKTFHAKTHTLLESCGKALAAYNAKELQHTQTRTLEIMDKMMHEKYAQYDQFFFKTARHLIELAQRILELEHQLKTQSLRHKK